jgi:uncharacterized protein
MIDLDALRRELAARGDLRLSVKVIPKSSKTEIVGALDDGTVRIKVAAAPERGRANAALCAFLARTFGVPLSHVTVVSGETNPHKRVRITS